MAGEVEKFLIAKLKQALEETESREHYLFAKLFSVDRYFRILKDLLNGPKARASVSESGKKIPREILYLLDNVLSEWQQISKKPALEGMADARRLSKKLKKIEKDLKGGDGSVSSRGRNSIAQEDVQESLPKNLDTYRWSSRTVDPSRVYGLDDKVRFMERLLLRKESKNGFKAIAVVGMLGVGKTTLCQLMFNNPEVKKEFLPRIWVCLSKQPEDDQDNKKEVVKRMLMCLGVEDEIIESAGEDPDLGLQRLIFALRLQLMGKKYLVVLDDAWNSDKCFENLASGLSTQEESCYEQLAYGLPKGHGGTVIVTSRSEEIAIKMVGEENLHHLPPLEDKECCWQIFMDAVEKEGKTFPQRLEILKDLIIDKCAGLPVAAKMMGEIMHRNLSTISPVAHVQNQNQQPII